VFISKFNASGAFVWTEQYGGVKDDAGQSITVDVNRSIYATGAFKVTVDFDPSTATYNMTADSTDAYILKLTQPAPCTVATPTVTVSDACGSSTLSSSATTGTYLWSPGGGTTQTITVTTGGTYSVTVSTGVSCSATSSG